MSTVGLTLGSSIGVYLVGKFGNETGSFSTTLRGGVLGGLGAFAIGGLVFVLKVVEGSYWATATNLVCYILPSLCATIGFNLTGRNKANSIDVSENEPNTRQDKFPNYFFKEKTIS
ncbi:hypothetical protein HYR99_09105 [Candidatus Poribacteria bacterium]|nr:hypothetical protein [Candidatus Poribacteria bacterium]